MTKSMADLATLRALRDRLDKATGPDWELDEALSIIFYPNVFAEAEKVNGVWKHKRFNAMIQIGYLTSSIDAAVALFERVLPGWSWGIGSDGASIWMNATKLCFESDGQPALALCRAIVAAMIAKEEANV